MEDNKINPSDENELPKLSLEQENAFKKMKMSLESNAIFPENFSKMLPPEVEGAFLDSILKFEKMYRESEKTTIYKKIGSPKIKNSDHFSDELIGNELKKLINRLGRKGIGFRTEYDYDARLIYDFIINELFQKEVDDLQMEGMILHFSYEDFYPNHAENLKGLTTGFLAMFLDNESKVYRKKYSKDAKNHKQINAFRACFEKFELIDVEATSVDFNSDETRAKVHFQIHFKGKVAGTGLIINYDGLGSITFKKKTRRWKLRTVELPISKPDDFERVD